VAAKQKLAILSINVIVKCRVLAFAVQIVLVNVESAKKQFHNYKKLF
jgi:hypothetical protein